MDSIFDFGFLAGQLDVHNSRFGIMDPIQATSVAFFRLTTEIQSHPVRAIGRLAIVVYCYWMAAGAENENFIDVSVKCSLISGIDSSILIAKGINWFTSPKIRKMAESKVKEMTGDGRNNPRWPWRQEITLPISFEPVGMDPRNRLPAGK